MGILLATFAAMGTFLHNLWRLFKKPEYRAGIIWLVLLLLVGMIFYHQVESLTWLDALYFSVITLSTVGYGDISPTTTVSKVFTMVYILFGLSIFASFASMLVRERVELQKERAEKRGQKSKSNENE
jgi:voltage-gated potassium channel Kch